MKVRPIAQNAPQDISKELTIYVTQTVPITLLPTLPLRPAITAWLAALPARMLHLAILAHLGTTLDKEKMSAIKHA